MRDPANRLYDSACEVLIATRTVAAELSRPGCEEALAATLGCVEESMRELERVRRELRHRMGTDTHAATPARPIASPGRAREEDMGLLQRLRGVDTSEEAACPRCNLPTPATTPECAACGWDTRESYHAAPGSTVVPDEVGQPQ